ncbi:MAG TPA: hypothetical protein VNL77_04045, partial [Roseiflexaceae bacterium]|nr:hypothetical protein [Roseiflexaceae bacterium]
MVRQVSFVIRVHGLEGGALRGQIEHVPSGTTAHFRDMAQAERFMRGYMGGMAGDQGAIPSTGEGVSSIFSFSRRP